MISIKGFHLFFIFVSIILTMGFGIFELQSNQNGIAMILGIVSLLASITLIIYGFKVFRKFKTLT